MAHSSDTPKDPDFLEENRAPAGHIPNFVTTFAARPAVFEAWKQLNGAIKASPWTCAGTSWRPWPRRPR